MTEEIPHIIDDIIRARRTSMLVDKERPVPNELIEELCELASWAPNHKRTWPWRFAAITGPAQLRFGDTVAEAMAAFLEKREPRFIGR